VLITSWKREILKCERSYRTRKAVIIITVGNVVTTEILEMDVTVIILIVMETKIKIITELKEMYEGR